jgi:large subunit ribosomal protein L21
VQLNEHGIHAFRQIASWTQDDCDRFGLRLKFCGRIEREAWIEQARKLTGKH